MHAREPCRRSGRSPDATGECPDASGRCRPRLTGRSQPTQAVLPRSHRVVRDAGGHRGRDRHAWRTLVRSPPGWHTPRGCVGQLWIIVTGVGMGVGWADYRASPNTGLPWCRRTHKIAGHAGTSRIGGVAARGDPAVVVAVESRSAARTRAPTRRTRQSIFASDAERGSPGGSMGGGSRPLRQSAVFNTASAEHQGPKSRQEIT